MEVNNIFNDLVNESIKASFEKEAKEINDSQNLTIYCIKKVFGRKYAKQATKTINDVFIGPYKFVGDREASYYGGYNYALYFINHREEKVVIDSLADFGDYIKTQSEYKNVLNNTFGENNRHVL